MYQKEYMRSQEKSPQPRPCECAVVPDNSHPRLTQYRGTMGYRFFIRLLEWSIHLSMPVLSFNRHEDSIPCSVSGRVQIRPKIMSQNIHIPSMYSFDGRYRIDVDSISLVDLSVDVVRLLVRKYSYFLIMMQQQSTIMRSSMPCGTRAAVKMMARQPSFGAVKCAGIQKSAQKLTLNGLSAKISENGDRKMGVCKVARPTGAGRDIVVTAAAPADGMCGVF